MTPRSPLLCYGAALVIVAVAVLTTLAVEPALGREAPFLFLWPAMVFAAWQGGFGPGFLATVLSALSANYWLLAPRHSFGIEKPAEAAELLLFVTLGTLICFLVEMLHRARTKAEERTRELQSAQEKVKQLQGLLPICAWCKRIRDDQDYWQEVESYISSRTEARFTHGICPACLKKATSELP